MLARLPYRVQIPLGLSVAVVIAALLVTAISAQISARTARQEILGTLDRAVALLAAQARPLLTADDTWRVYALLRNTAALLPGAEAGHARAAVLDGEGRVVAASEPAMLETGSSLLGEAVHGTRLPPRNQVTARVLIDRADDALNWIDPIRSEDGQVLGFVYIEVDAPVFAPDWVALGKPALIGAGLAVALLVPAGWWIGRRMTRPVARIIQVIERIGRADNAVLRADVPRTADPELGRISDAVDQLIAEMQVRQKAEQRALSAERMAAVGRMTAAVAHEINNPLGGLLTATQTLRVHGASEDTRRSALDLLQRGLNQIRTTVAALLPQARIEDRPLEISDLDDVITLAQPACARRSVQLSGSTEVESAMRVPSAAMRQVMLNLLLNAIKAAGDHGTVQALLRTDADAVRFVVTNSGERLLPSALERSIVDESGDDPHGFGLWICREIATQYAGGFALDQTYAQGTRLEFWIPNRESHE